ncbi:LysR family transcriptional regulator [Phytoactinopolyspora alkaliphila]|uniref:LysR family transcriptional regulator n=1 Tax=Phytoactinopolyspora alkaliphila TaxID=1783498 RepID=A0A6N9YS14_9ACTN|nr:LysR family transcriptional regulator [Phytoactinopolyspora alkaliphila]
MSITLQRLEFFRAVARHLSFSAAAKELYTSQPYVSNQIRKLEDHFGARLFVRSQPKISLTEAGAALHKRIEQILSDIEQLDHVARQFHGLQRGTVRFAATESIGNHVMPELIARFHREHPSMIVQGRIGNTEEVLEWLDLREVEIGISPQIPEDPAVISAPFYREALVVIYPTSMDLPDPLPLERFAELPKIVREGGSLTRARMYELLDPESLGTTIVGELSGTTAVNEAVVTGLAVSLVPEQSARTWIEAGLVRSCALAGVTLSHDFHLLHTAERDLTLAARAFIEHLLSYRELG